MGKITASKIGAPRRIVGDGLGNLHVDVEWSHSDGHFQHSIEKPVYGPDGPPDITYQTKPGEVVQVLKDTITINPHGLSDGEIQEKIKAEIAKKQYDLENKIPIHHGLKIVAPKK